MHTEFFGTIMQKNLMISARLIDAFLALAETKRFVVAARRCNVSPSAMSQMIARLETQVGARLFDRNTRTVALTPEGEVFSSGARRSANEIMGAIAELQDRAARRSGTVAIAAPPSLTAEWLPSLLGDFRRLNPDLILKLRDVVSDACLELVLRGSVDFAMGTRHGNELEFDTALFRDERFHVVCREDDPLARFDSVSLRQLKGRDFIQLVRTGSVWRHVQDALRRAAVRDIGMEVDQFSTVAGLVAAGFGVSLVPESVLSVCRRDGVVAVPAKDKAISRPLFMIKRKGRSLSSPGQALWDFVQASGAARSSHGITTRPA
ncbi:LysR family transcriptional regulator [soil metagenome]